LCTRTSAAPATTIERSSHAEPSHSRAPARPRPCCHGRGTPEAADLPREDWLGLLVDREATSRDNKRLARRLRDAKLRQAAVVEDTDFRTPRGLDRALFLKLAGCGWIREHAHVVIGGPTGVVT